MGKFTVRLTEGPEAAGDSASAGVCGLACVAWGRDADDDDDACDLQRGDDEPHRQAEHRADEHFLPEHPHERAERPEIELIGALDGLP